MKYLLRSSFVIRPLVRDGLVESSHFYSTALEVLRARGTAPLLKRTDPPEDTKESSRQLEDRAELDDGVIDLLSDNDEGTTSSQVSI